MANLYTNVIYQHLSIIIDLDSQYHRIVATQAIPRHSLLLVEHIIVGKTTMCHLVIQENELLFNNLYPRIHCWNDQHSMALEATKKIEANGFYESDDETSIGLAISKINHSCNPNSVVRTLDQIQIMNIKTEFIAVYALKDISAGEEVTIMYYHDAGHRSDYDFQCLCGRTKEQRTLSEEKINSLDRAYPIQDADLKILSAYYQTKDCFRICLYQYLAHQGCIMNNNKLTTVTDNFKKLVPGNYEENIKSWISQVINVFRQAHTKIFSL